MTPKGVLLERERRFATPVAIAAIVSALLVLAAVLVSGGLLDTDNDASQLRSADDHSSELVLLSIVQAIGLAGLSIPLYYLFRAAQGRSDAVRAPLVGFAFIGPILFAVQSILTALALNDVASDFVARDLAGGGMAETVAEDLKDDSSFLQVASGLAFPAVLGVLIAVVYIPLHAVRVGLLTRFWGTLGMALGVSIIIIPFGIVGLLLWFVYVGLIIGGWVPGGRPPAWEAGEAVPWPVPGEERGDDEQEGEEPVPATAQEVGALADEDEGPRADHPSSQKRKRKRRR